ncbi:GyrI-like domain-containing protein [Photobacterium sp. 2_MG-2023]|uniref:GyrI-like domain-containing protein n=1 Tax=Photobacterium arenosum TaxID=2774143 RepID=A0ABR9BFX1_9GAMM|nr:MULTISPECIES: GyrI-like domain-containing protein [Photobacterium]MBD8511456.1 GyrI-like domain-containing protein [Photobacterium arenosum]MDO6583261.1 GyrI-like domain-containing protein [Photobacterium sp. 2_MG-2023]
MQKEKLSANWLAYVEVQGPYGENYDPALSTLFGWAAQQGLQGGRCIFVYLDDVEKTPPQECRTRVGITVPESTQVEGPIALTHLPGGDYATLRKQVTDKTQYGRYWQQLHQEIAEETKMQFDDERPCFELYHSVDEANDICDTSFCIPVK